MELDDLIELSAQQRRNGDSVEQILASLRAQGASIVDSLKVVRAVEGVRLGRAKEIIDNSKTWADARESNDELRSIAVQSIEESEDPPVS
ncbi:MAG: hypothetical protein GY722_00970 [bacterium]|nr:hypothetical protein [bacterium]